ncbi:hypothetical protein FACS189447_03240 [Spirochaetia bacterium]|nr:hypothetical protein FACS189447_03240 [Spirochaetia bacterium]
MSTFPHTVSVEIAGITFANRRMKFRKAVSRLAKSLNIDYEIIKSISHKQHTQEPYFYKVQEELSDRWNKYFYSIIQSIYKATIEALGLPPVEVETIKKALNDSVLKYRGKIVYSPETGEPMNKKDLDDLVNAIEKFLNRKTAGTGEKMVLDSISLGKLLRRMGKFHTTKEMEDLTLDTLKYRGKTFDWISDSVKNLRNALGEELSRSEQAKYQVAQDWVANKVTQISRQARDEIKDTILNGIREHRGKSQVSQDLFNRLGGLNRDWRRIANTELVNTANLAGIMEEVHQAPEGEKVYFKRYELPGCCDKCEQINGMVVLWSNTPLASDKIKDKNAKIAIWEGKPQDKGMNSVVTGTMHPNCRGGWTPWGGGAVDAMVVHIQNNGELWDRSVEKAREEFKAQGIDNPNDQTKGYKDRINELYRIQTE